MAVGVGPVYWFSKQEVKAAADLKKQKIFVWAGDPVGTETWKDQGFNPVPLSMTDLASSLKTGMVEAFSNLPVYTSALQLHHDAKYMLRLEWSFIMVGVFIRSDKFAKISKEDQDVIWKAMAKSRKDLERKTKFDGEKTLSAMADDGLKIHKPSSEELEGWVSEADRIIPTFKGKLIPKGIYEKFMALKKKSPYAKKKKEKEVLNKAPAKKTIKSKSIEDKSKKIKKG